MAEMNHNLDREAMRAVLNEYISSKDDIALDRLCGILEQSIADERGKAQQEIEAAQGRAIAIPGLALDSALSYFDAISTRINQVDGILGLLGAADPDEVNDSDFNNAAWGARHLLGEASVLAEAAILNRPIITELETATP